MTSSKSLLFLHHHQWEVVDSLHHFHVPYQEVGSHCLLIPGYSLNDVLPTMLATRLEDLLDTYCYDSIDEDTDRVHRGLFNYRDSPVSNGVLVIFTGDTHA